MTASATARPAAGTVALLRLLSLALAPPTSDGTDELASLAGALADRPEPPRGLDDLVDALAGSSPEELAAEHERLFGGDVAVPPYEGSYEVDPFRQARQLADVAGFYRAFGAEAGGPSVERADHAGTELEFLAFLGLRRLQACERGDDDEATRCAEIERAFLREHAGRWLPVFFSALAERAPGATHRAVGVLGGELVASELARHGVSPDPVPTERRPRTALDADELECGGTGPEDTLALIEPHARRRSRRRQDGPARGGRPGAEV